MPARVGALRTGFGKRPMAGKVKVGRQNLDGDGQADRRYHGGPDMAVLAFSAGHYPSFREELSWPELAPGALGENLSVDGVSEESACIGDVWRAGTALLQIASPRKPCKKIAAYWQRPELLALVQRTGRSGFYLRVAEEGLVWTGAPLAVLERPHPAWTVARAYRAALGRPRDRDAARQLAEVAELSARWRAWLRGLPARV